MMRRNVALHLVVAGPALAIAPRVGGLILRLVR